MATMSDETAARIYARSFYELANDSQTPLMDELGKFWDIMHACPDLESLLFLSVFSREEKSDVFLEISKKLSLSPMVENFFSFLIQEARISLLPQIFKELVVLDDDAKGFIRGEIEGKSDELPAEFEERIKKLVEQTLNKKPLFEYKKNDSLTAGYRITVGDQQIDATFDGQLNEFKKQLFVASDAAF